MTKEMQTLSLVIASALVCGCAVEADDELAASAQEVTTTASAGKAVFQHLLSGNGLSQRALTSITPSSLAYPALVDDDSGRELLQLAVGCALPAGMTVAIYDSYGTKHVFVGAIGLAPEWLRGPLGGTSQERWVSGCILARTNRLGSVSMSLRGNHPALARVAPTEAAQYTDYEASFYGNLFVTAEDRIACEGDLGLVIHGGGPIDDYLDYRMCGDATCVKQITNNQYCMPSKVSASLRTDGVPVRGIRTGSPFALANTSSATTSVAWTPWVYLYAGERFVAGTTNLPGAAGGNDTYLRLWRWNGGPQIQVAYNDDATGYNTLLSYLDYTVAATDWYYVAQGCYGTSSCWGTTAYLDATTIEEGAQRRTRYALPASQAAAACRRETVQAETDMTANPGEVAEAGCSQSLATTNIQYDEVVSVYLQPYDSGVLRTQCAASGGCR